MVWLIAEAAMRSRSVLSARVFMTSELILWRRLMILGVCLPPVVRLMLLLMLSADSLERFSLLLHWSISLMSCRGLPVVVVVVVVVAVVVAAAGVDRCTSVTNELCT